MTSRQQQRQQERLLLKQGQAALTKGLPVTPQKSDVVAVALVVARALQDKADATRASRAAALVHALSEASTKRTPGEAKLACRKGCGYCCHTWVGATAPEVLHLASALRADAARNPDSTISGILARSAAIAGRTPAERFGTKLPCPLLVSDACSRYRERPTVCRQATSLDLAACIEEFEGQGRGEDMPVSSVYLAHARNARVPLLAALALAKLPAYVYELSSGLARALEVEDAEPRWLGGEDVFVGVPQGPGEGFAVKQAVTAIVHELGGLGRTTP